MRYVREPCSASLLFVALAGVPSLACKVTAVTAGNYHTCALFSVPPIAFSSGSSGVTCWGRNDDGQLGNGSNTGSAAPVLVSSSGVVGATAITAGGAHTCALTSGGGVLCWGNNSYGQVGDGSTTKKNVPVAVAGLGSGVTSISAGLVHTCALTSGGRAVCWGANFRGQLGNGSNLDSTVPVAVSGLDSGVTAIAAGGEHTCALTGSGGPVCWGDNMHGQLGDGSTTSSNVPVALSGLDDGVTAIAAGGPIGGSHTCAIVKLTIGTGFNTIAGCWGANDYGQLGNGNNTESDVPVAARDLTAVTAISAGGVHTCALTSSGGAVCWGANFSGQLGNGSNADSNVPVAVSALGSGVTAISAGRFEHACAVTSASASPQAFVNGVQCWGRNDYGQLGNGSQADSNLPVAVLGL
jgi:alpha-tubulin suppressor-like RCC1 family protein